MPVKEIQLAGREASMRQAICFVLVLGVATFAGCGESAEDKANSTITDFYAAIEKADGQKACSYLAVDIQKEFARVIEAALGAKPAPCAQAVEALSGSQRA